MNVRHCPPSAPDFATLQAAARSIAIDVAAAHAADVDAQARFPAETLSALRDAQLLSAAVPREFGGSGCSLRELGQLCAQIAQACGSSGMVLAMHYSQVACLARHADGHAAMQHHLREIAAHQHLLASMTSEVGTFGDTRSSVCAVEIQGDRFVLNKDATTGSYCAQADVILVTCRRSPEAPNNDQVLVLVRPEDRRLTQTTSWDTMGMRGTCSPGYRLEAAGPASQVFPMPFAEVLAQSMVPYSHVLWAALWTGIATDAVQKAASHVRSQARKTPGTPPPTAQRLAEVSVQLQSMRQHWQSVAEAYDICVQQADAAQALLGMAWSLRFNNLKIALSEAAPQVVHKALQIVGLLGYKNDSPLSLSRQYRDVLSASLMLSNDRIAAQSASMLLVLKETP
jgi:acyl-CoA dehydrogenase